VDSAGPRWLSPDEQRAWRAFLDASHLLFECLDRSLQRDSDLSSADYEILVHLSEAQDRRLRMRDLADGTTFSRSRLSHAMSRLERAGWVRREACPSDKRGTVAVLTEHGFSALEAAAPGHVAAVRRYMFDGLGTDQVAQLEDIANTVRARLEPDAGTCDL
jgi:DNA-binding MarR family transcriptional regulator